ncbi:MAG TPA: ABC transporter substrate-binding protein, partial [Hyphomicrobiaceae bacterium]|nr:ABC transporter substrate-binding protein [Hyphomicrobiaceae bacterium]
MRTLSLTLALTIAVALPLAGSTATAEPPRRHALAKIGDPATPADFKHFSWVQPDAPKGGSVRLSAIGSFDTLNSFSIQGVTAPALSALVDATLMAPSPDEPATAYGLIAEWVSVADDISSVTFGLRASARFADGTPVTAEDVIFSFEEQKRAAPAIAIYYRDVTRAERTGDREVTFHFARKGARDLPYAVGLLTVIPRHFWSGKTPGGEPRDLAKSTLEVPIGAGPYRVKALDRGRSITYERVKDWWAKDLPVNIGQFNFDELHFIMFRDDVPEFEALKAGEIDLKEENSSKKWATAYTFPASRDGRVKKLEL